MPGVQDYVKGYGKQDYESDANYLDGHDFDPVKSFYPEVEIATGEEDFNLKRDPIVGA